MKTTITYITATILLVISLSVNAQQPAKRNSEEKAKMEAGGLKKQLSLTDEQTVKCEQIIRKYAGELAQPKRSATDSLKQNKTRQQLVAKRNAEINALLTPAQQEVFEKWQQEKRRRNGKAMRKVDAPAK